MKPMIEDNINTFKKEVHTDNLFNTCTGRSYKESTQDCLWNAESIGKGARKRFVEGCIENCCRFEKIDSKK